MSGYSGQPNELRCINYQGAGPRRCVSEASTVNLFALPGRVSEASTSSSNVFPGRSVSEADSVSSVVPGRWTLGPPVSHTRTCFSDPAAQTHNLEHSLEHAQWAELEALARQRIAAQPGVATWHNYLGVSLGGRGMHSDAVQAFAEAVRLQPTNTEHRRLFYVAQELMSSPEKAKAHELQRDCRWTELEALARQGLAAEPVSVRWHNFLGISLGSQGKHFEAAQAFAAAVGLEPTNVEYRKMLSAAQERMDAPHLARAYRLQRDSCWPELEALARQQVGARPGDATWHSFLGTALSNMGDHFSAVQSYTEAVRLQPTKAEHRDNLDRAQANLKLQSATQQLMQSDSPGRSIHTSGLVFGESSGLPAPATYSGHQSAFSAPAPIAFDSGCAFRECSSQPVAELVKAMEAEAAEIESNARLLADFAAMKAAGRRQGQRPSRPASSLCVPPLEMSSRQHSNPRFLPIEI